jgi:hypothetical protein
MVNHKSEKFQIGGFNYLCYGIHKLIRRYKWKSYRFTTKYHLRKINKTCNASYQSNKLIEQIETICYGNKENLAKHISITENEGIIARADKIMNQTYDLLGSGPTILDPVNWHIDFKTGFEWPYGKFYKDYVEVDLSTPADVKLPRELSRAHHFLHLGQAYLLTNNEKYTEEFVKQINNWIDENQLNYSINWACAMDVGIRAINWLYALNMFKTSDLVTDQLLKRIYNSLYQHGWFVMNNLEKIYKGNSNHYDSNLVALLVLGFLFKDSDQQALKWYNYAKYSTYEEIRFQILPSGVYYECSLNYTRLVNEIFTFSLIFLKHVGERIPSDVNYRIKLLHDFTSAYIKDNGLSPVIGDQDDGRLLPFGLEQNIDHRHLLGLSSAYFNDPILKSQCGDSLIDQFFYFSEDELNKYIALKPTTQKKESILYPDGGFYILRSEDTYMFINNSGQGKYLDDPFMGNGHTHADLLSFELNHLGQDIFIDPGSYAYTSNAAERNHFRSTRMHNTIMIDGKDIYELNDKNLFKFDSKCFPLLESTHSTPEYDYLEASHDGYQRMEDPVTHKRSFKLNKTSNKIIELVDTLVSKEEHQIDINFILHPNWQPSVAKNGFVLEFEDKVYTLRFKVNQSLDMQILSTYYSNQYGVKHPTKALRVSFTKSKGEQIIISVLSMEKSI